MYYIYSRKSGKIVYMSRYIRRTVKFLSSLKLNDFRLERSAR